MKKIFVITGLTATGKTGLAIKTARKMKADVISADSRQVYKGMDIGTGKDIGKSKFKSVTRLKNMDIGYYVVEGIRIWLLDIIEPSVRFSISDYLKAFDGAYHQIEKRGRSVIVVGGTGFYVESIIRPKQNFNLAPNKTLRWFLNKLPTKMIKFVYKLIRRNDFERLNNSEKNNRHRLIRKIELCLVNKNKGSVNKKYEGRIICLTAPNKSVYKKIDKRVKIRLDQGLIKEVERLKNRYGWKAPGLNCLAYKEFKDYFDGNANLTDCIEKWKYDEHGYARRQKTWFKKRDYEMIDIEKSVKLDGTIFYE